MVSVGCAAREHEIKHIEGGTDQYTRYIQWDNHRYSVKSSRPFVQKPVTALELHYDTQRVPMDRGVKKTCETWV